MLSTQQFHLFISKEDRNKKKESRIFPYTYCVGRSEFQALKVAYRSFDPDLGLHYSLLTKMNKFDRYLETVVAGID